MGRLEGKTAIITGAASGIGRSSALLFAREGANVVIADIDHEGACKVEEEIASANGRAIAVRTDVTEEQSMLAMIGMALSAFGSINILYNNAGGSTPWDSNVVDAPVDEFWRAIKLDLWGTFLGCKLVIPHIVRAGGGAIINTTSNVALIGCPGVDCYTAAKGGVAALTRSLAVEFASKRIRVNAIAPTITMTPRVAERIKTAVGASGHASRNHLGLAYPEDIALTALYLASDDSRMTTGSIQAPDGGSTIS